MKTDRNVFKIEMVIIIFSLLLVVSSKQKAKNEEAYCTTEDFFKIKKIDMHCRINCDRPVFMELSIADNFKILTINTDVSSYPPIEEQQKVALNQIKLNYDFSNIQFLYKGEKAYDEGLGNAIPYMAHLHLKNIKLQNGDWPVCNLEEGIIDYQKIFSQYPQLLGIPMSMELSVRFG